MKRKQRRPPGTTSGGGAKEEGTMIDHITWLGHASVLITGEKTIYIDPYQLKDPNPPIADLVLITHDHYDHCSPEDIERVIKADTVVLAPECCRGKINKNLQVAAAGERLQLQGLQVETFPAYNTDKSFHPKSDGGLGYVVTVNGQRVYHAGDTDLIPEMADIHPDVAILPVGGTYTMNPEQAAQAVERLEPKLAIPIHYGAIVGSVKDAQNFQKLAKCPVKILAAKH